MKRNRIVQAVKAELKGQRRQKADKLMDNLKKALARRGIK